MSNPRCVKIQGKYMICEKHASRPKQFKVTVGTDDLRFNQILAVDIIYINEKPVLHVVDEATHYQAAVSLRRFSAEETWKAILHCWFRVYLGPPDYLLVDQGTNFFFQAFSQFCRRRGNCLIRGSNRIIIDHDTC